MTDKDDPPEQEKLSKSRVVALVKWTPALSRSTDGCSSETEIISWPVKL